MPVGDLKISNLPTFPSSTSVPRRPYYSSYKSSSYTPSSYRSSQLRASSLDRSSTREPVSSNYRLTGSHFTPKTAYGDYGSVVRPSHTTLTSTDSYRRYDPSEILSRVSYLSNSSTTRNYNSRKCVDAISDASSYPVLTNFRDLKESSYESRRSGERRLSSSTNCSASSQTSSAYESSPAARETGLSSPRKFSSALHSSPAEEANNAPVVTYLPNHLHFPSSSSLLSPASSTDDVSEVTGHHLRRSSTLTGGTSGYSSSDHTSSSSSSSFRANRDGVAKGGLVGLRNLGNTCFMNSVLQCLSNTKPLLEYCLKDFYVNEINTTTSSMKGALFKAFASLLQSMWKGNESAVNPQSFKNQIQKFAPRFMGYSQQDAQEFLRYLLQGLHEDVNRVSTKPKPITTEIDESLSESQKSAESWKRYLRFDESKIVDIFVGQLKSTLQCTVCGHSSVTFDPFWDLSLPIPKATGQVRLQQCFDLFTRVEHLDGDEKPTCAKCKTRRKCTKGLTIQKFPKVLVIHLKRFSPSERYRSKLSTNVEFPATNLDLGSYASNTNRNPPCVYNLYAVSNHSGTIYSGHYTAYCKHPYTGEWHDFNDSKVMSLSLSSLATSEAYVLFYELANQSSRL